jgi:hypothetical protein
VDVDIQAELVLDANAVLDLVADEFVVLLLRNLAFGELVSLDADLLGLCAVTMALA